MSTVAVNESVPCCLCMRLSDELDTPPQSDFALLLQAANSWDGLQQPRVQEKW